MSRINGNLTSHTTKFQINNTRNMGTFFNSNIISNNTISFTNKTVPILQKKVSMGIVDKQYIYPRKIKEYDDKKNKCFKVTSKPSFIANYGDIKEIGGGAEKYLGWSSPNGIHTEPILINQFYNLGGQTWDNIMKKRKEIKAYKPFTLFTERIPCKNCQDYLDTLFSEENEVLSVERISNTQDLMKTLEEGIYCNLQNKHSNYTLGDVEMCNTTDQSVYMKIAYTIKKEESFDEAFPSLSSLSFKK